MRLILKIAIVYALISFLVFLIGGVLTYRVMSNEIEYEQQRFLLERLPGAIRFIERRSPKDTVVRGKMIIVPMDSLVEGTKPSYSDTIVMHSTLMRLEPHAKLDVVKIVKERPYKITLYDLVVEQDDIKDGVRESMAKTYLILLIAVLLISLIVSYYIFKPFNETLDVIKRFSILDKNKVKLPRSSTREFKRLNVFIKEMTDKVKSDYQSLKEFSENASHEIQTPLAIVNGKLELLLEFENLSEKQMELITSAQNALRRLSKTSNSLNLLTKIGNQEFSELSKIDFSQLVLEIVNEFKELIGLKSLDLIVDVEEEFTLMCNQVLIEILLSNLLNNAVRHNHKKGFINLKLNKEELIVENSGNPFDGNPEDLFGRFRKGSDHPESSGLGLSIVKMICDQHDFKIVYTSEEERHKIIIKFAASQ